MPDTFLTGSIDLILNNTATNQLKTSISEAIKIISNFNSGPNSKLNIAMPKIAPLNKANLNNITTYEKSIQQLVSHTAEINNFASALQKVASVKLPKYIAMGGMLNAVNPTSPTGANPYPPSILAAQQKYLATLNLIASKELDIKNMKAQQVQSQQKANTGLSGWLASSAQMLATQVYYAAVWTTIYGTINSINTSIKEGIQLFAQLEQGLGRAMSTGLNKEQVAGSFKPESRGGFEETKQKMKEIAGLQALLFTSQHKASVEQYTSALYELTSAGMSLQSSLKMVDTSLKISIAAQGDVAQVTRTMAGLYNIFKDRIKDVSGEQEKFNQIGNTVLYTWAKEQMELSELNNALKYSANIAQMMNIDYRVLVATIGHLNTMMLRGSTAGTGLRQMLSSSAKDLGGLQELFGQGAEALKQYAQENDRAFDPSKPLDFIGVLGKLRDQLIKTHGGAKDLTFTANDLKKAFGAFDIRGANVVLTLLNSYDQLKQKISDVTNLQSNYIDTYVRLRELDPATQFQIFIKNLQAIPAAFVLGLEKQENFAKAMETLNKDMSTVIATAFMMGSTFQDTWKSATDNQDTIISGLDKILNQLASLLSILNQVYYITSSLEPVLNFFTSINKKISEVGANITFHLLNAVATVNYLIDGLKTLSLTQFSLANFFKVPDKENAGWKTYMKSIAQNAKNYIEQIKSLEGEKKVSLEDLIKGKNKDVDWKKLASNTMQSVSEVVNGMNKGQQGMIDKTKELSMTSKTYLDDIKSMADDINTVNSQLTEQGNIQGAIVDSMTRYGDLYSNIANSYGDKTNNGFDKQLQNVKNLSNAYSIVNEELIRGYNVRQNKISSAMTPEGFEAAFANNIEQRKAKTPEQPEAVKGVLSSINSFETVIVKMGAITKDLAKANVKMYPELNKYWDLIQDDKGFQAIKNKQNQIKNLEVDIQKTKEFEDKAIDARKKSKNPIEISSLNIVIKAAQDSIKRMGEERNNLVTQMNQDASKLGQKFYNQILSDAKLNQASLDAIDAQIQDSIKKIHSYYELGRAQAFKALGMPGLSPQEKERQSLVLNQQENMQKYEDAMRRALENKKEYEDKLSSIPKGPQYEVVRSGLEQDIREQQINYESFLKWKLAASAENAEDLKKLDTKQKNERLANEFQLYKDTMSVYDKSAYEITHKYDSLLTYYAGNKQKEYEIGKKIEEEKKDLTIKLAEEENDKIRKLGEQRLADKQDLATAEFNLEKETSKLKLMQAGTAYVQQMALTGSDEQTKLAMDKLDSMMKGLDTQWDIKGAMQTQQMSEEKQKTLNESLKKLEENLALKDQEINRAKKGSELQKTLKEQRESIVNEINKTNKQIIDAKLDSVKAQQEISKSQMSLATMSVGETDPRLKGIKKQIGNTVLSGLTQNASGITSQLGGFTMNTNTINPIGSDGTKAQTYYEWYTQKGRSDSNDNLNSQRNQYENINNLNLPNKDKLMETLPGVTQQTGNGMTYYEWAMQKPRSQDKKFQEERTKYGEQYKTNDALTNLFDALTQKDLEGKPETYQDFYKTKNLNISEPKINQVNPKTSNIPVSINLTINGDKIMGVTSGNLINSTRKFLTDLTEEARIQGFSTA